MNRISLQLLFVFIVIAVNCLPGALCAQEWQEVARSEYYRYRLSSTVLQDGRVLIVGGEMRDGGILKQDPWREVEIYDPNTQTLSRAASSSSPHSHHNAVLLDDGRVLVFGGQGDYVIAKSGLYRSSEIYDPVADTWSAAAAPLFYGFSMSAVKLQDGRVLVTGGSGKRNSDPPSTSPDPLSLSQIYDPSSDTWTFAADLPATRGGHEMLVLHDGTVMVGPGLYTGGGARRQFDRYDPQNDTWNTLPLNPIENSAKHRMVLLSNGDVLTVCPNPEVLGKRNSVAMYIPSKNEWEVLESTRENRSSYEMIVLPDDRVWIVGGAGSEDFEAVVRATEEYNPVIQQWIPINPLPQIRAGHTLEYVSNGEVLVIGGIDPEQNGYSIYSRPVGELEGFTHLSGRVWYDFNGDGRVNGEDAPMPDVLVSVTPDQYIGHSTAEGKYSLYVTPGTYEICAPAVRHWAPSWPQTDSKCHDVEVNGDGAAIGGLDFGMQPIGVVRELDVCIIASQARPGFELTYWLTFRNSGTVPYNGTLQFTYDPILQFERTSVPADDTQAGMLLWGLENVAIGEERTIEITFTVPADIELLGEELCASAEYDHNQGDDLIRAGEDEFCDIIRGSYDPNEIVVSPRGLGERGILSSDNTLLSYTIYFQNLGTDTAFNVRINNPIHPNLDAKSFEFGQSSHPVDVTISRDGILTFRFDNILLPHKAADEPGSQGFVRYYMNAITPVDEALEIKNDAGIYFDYNPAIMTNTVLTTLTLNTTSIAEGDLPAAVYGLTISPNPAANNFVVKGLEFLPWTAQLIDVLGSEYALTWTARGSELRFDSSGLGAGRYWLSLVFDGGATVSLPLVIER